MAPLGKQLVFHLKYMAEMNRLYYDPEEGEEPGPTGLDNLEQLREMLRSVATAADEQAADFLELCGRGIEDYFTGIGATLASKRKRTSVLRDWYWWVHVRVPSVPSDGFFSCAVVISSASEDDRASLGQDVCGTVEPYIWLKGGRKGSEAVWNILGGWPRSRGRSTVTLACIPIKAQSPESFDVDRNPLIAEVVQTIARIGVEETTAIANFVAGLKEVDES